jgi:diguanylate cyclase
MKISAYTATHDGLTGLPNDFLFNDRLNQVIAISERSASRFALLLIALKNDKEIQRQYGQNVADRLILQIAESLQKTLREPDTISRKNNNTFCILLPQIKTQLILKQLVIRIEKELAKPFNVLSNEIYIKTRVGYGIYPDNGVDASGLYRYVESKIANVNQQLNNLSVVKTGI